MLVFDIEANGLLDTITKMHCSFTINPLSLEVHYYDSPQELTKALVRTDLCIGHNIIGYDLPALQVLTGQHIGTPVFDTIVLGRLLNPEGQHSLETYGQKLGFPKGTYTGGWEALSEEMIRYCHQDVLVSAVLFLELVKRAKFEEQLGIPKEEIPKLQKAIRSIKYG